MMRIIHNSCTVWCFYRPMENLQVKTLNFLVLQKAFPNNLITFSCVYVLTFRDILFVKERSGRERRKVKTNNQRSWSAASPNSLSSLSPRNLNCHPQPQIMLKQ